MNYDRSSNPKAPRKAAQDATSLYRTRQRNIQKLMAELSTELDKHAKDQKKHSTDWGYAGDLGTVEQLLAEAVKFLHQG